MENSLHFDKNLPLGRYLSLLTKSYIGALSKRMEHLGIERYYSIFLLVEATKEGCTQQYISDYLKIDKASLVKRLDYLCKKGLITRKVNPKDRREHNIILTEKGRKLLPEVHKAVSEINAAALHGLKPEQADIFYQALETIYENVKELPSYKVVVNFKKTKT